MRLDLGLKLQNLCAQLSRSAHIPPPDENFPVMITGVVCGTIRPALAYGLSNALIGFRVYNDHLILDEHNLNFETRTAALHDAALWLLDRGFIDQWRNEALAVVADVKQPPVARIERSAARALGLTTFSVHLNAWCENELWLARRATHKNINPGLWDTLVGGLITANESERVALDREAFEEAGLVLRRYHPQPFRRIHVWRPIPEGYQSEVLYTFDVTLPESVAPINHDGQIDAIQRHSQEETLAAIEAHQVTLEASLCTLESLTRRSGLDIGDQLFF